MSEIVARLEMSRVSLSHFEARCVVGSASVDPESNFTVHLVGLVLAAASAHHLPSSVRVLSLGSWSCASLVTIIAGKTTVNSSSSAAESSRCDAEDGASLRNVCQVREAFCQERDPLKSAETTDY